MDPNAIRSMMQSTWVINQVTSVVVMAIIAMVALAMPFAAFFSIRSWIKEGRRPRGRQGRYYQQGSGNTIPDPAQRTGQEEAYYDTFFHD